MYLLQGKRVPPFLFPPKNSMTSQSREKSKGQENVRLDSRFDVCSHSNVTSYDPRLRGGDYDQPWRTHYDSSGGARNERGGEALGNRCSSEEDGVRVGDSTFDHQVGESRSRSSGVRRDSSVIYPRSDRIYKGCHVSVLRTEDLGQDCRSWRRTGPVGSVQDTRTGRPPHLERDTRRRNWGQRSRGSSLRNAEGLTSSDGSIGHPPGEVGDS